jgi:hypothetical protein
MTGVAQAADSIDDLASFLGGEPEEAREGEENAEDQPEGESEEDGEPDESEEESEEAPEEQASRKIKVPVKGEDGVETGTEEVDESELVSGYMRQKAFTQKTMELSTREKQATEIVQQRVTEASQYALQQANAAKAVIVQLAGLRSEDELQHMAINDPAGWVQEQERSRQVNALWERVDASAKVEQERITRIEQEKTQAQTTAAWEVLTAAGIDRQKLADLYGSATKAYGITNDQLGKVTDPGLVMALKDALAYRELQAKKPQVTQKVKEAARLPTTKKALPTSERVNKSLGEKFSRGKARVNDLAAFLSNNKL